MNHNAVSTRAIHKGNPHHHDDIDTSRVVARIKQALTNLERFAAWTIGKSSLGGSLGRPGMPSDCPLANFVKDTTGCSIIIGLDEHYRGIWWLAHQPGRVYMLPPAGEYIRCHIDRCVRIHRSSLIAWIDEWNAGIASQVGQKVNRGGFG